MSRDYDLKMSKIGRQSTEVCGHNVMMSWGFPSIHVAVPFSSVYLIIERCLRNHYNKFGGEPTSSEPRKNGNFPSAVKLCQTYCDDIIIRKSPWYRQL